jgi:protein TonB
MGWALAVSVALHLAVLATLPYWVTDVVPLEPGPGLRARLAAPVPAPVAETDRAERAVPDALSPPTPRARAPATRRLAQEPPATSAQANALPAQAEAVPAPAAAARASAGAGLPQAPVSPVTATPVPPQARADAPQELRGEDETASVAQYRIALMEAARAFKSYPALARENNWQGRVEVRVFVAAGGALAGVTVSASSGFQVLDQAALAMVRRAHARAALPAALRRLEFDIRVPVVYGLKDS